MFSKEIDHPLFKKLTRGLFGYSGILDIFEYNNIEISIKGRSEKSLEVAVPELSDLKNSLNTHLGKCTSDAFDAYEVMKDVVESGELDIEAEGGELPDIKEPKEIWNHMVLEEIWVEPEDKYIVRLSFRCPWDIEHDFGVYVSNKQYQYSGVSV